MSDARDIISEWDQAAKALPIEKRQAFLAGIWNGMTVCAAYEAAGITFKEAMGVIGMNVVEAKFLRTESV